MNIDLSRVHKGAMCVYAPNPGYTKAKGGWNTKPDDIQLAGPMLMTGRTEYFGNGVDDLSVEVAGQTVGEPEASKWWLRLSDLIVLN